MAGWQTLEQLVKLEIIARRDEGCDVTGFRERFDALEKTEQNLMAFYNELMALPENSSFDCPNELSEIRRLSKAHKNGEAGEAFKFDCSDEELFDKFYGAWLGRCIGCALGKPLETSWAFGGKKEPGYQLVYEWFNMAGQYPINDYAPKNSPAEEKYGISTVWENSTRDKISYMETDDDIRYTVLGLVMTERKGKDFDSYDVGKLWHDLLPYKRVCTAETQSYLNFAEKTAHNMGKPQDISEIIEYSRTHLNPYREWIGAQIRVDAYAYAAAGNPALAAELAYKDAAFSHVKNGIYGAMFLSAMISAAFYEKDPEKLIEIGLAEIPENCMLAVEVKKAVQMAKQAESELKLCEMLWDEYRSRFDAVHTINNAALIAAALIYGKGDFTKTVTLAVLGGWDTDCNGASVGSIMGAIYGANAIPEHWKNPLSDTLYSAIPDFHPIKISECAERSMKVYKKLSK